MSDHVLKASVRQTLAYIDAYDVNLLRAIEASFKEALHGCNDEGENAATQEPEPEPEPEQHSAPQPKHATTPSQTSHISVPAAVELLDLSTWHYRLPFISAIVITSLLLILAR